MNVIGIYPGRFQPPHRGHLKAYEYVKRIVGPNNAYVATSDKVDPEKSPLSYQEKQSIWTRHGVPIDKVVKVVNPYKSEEITHKFNPKNTAAIFFVSEKDSKRFPFKRPDGSPAYFQPYPKNNEQLEPIAKHAYIEVVPTYPIDGKKISGTKVREYLGSAKYTKEQKKKFFHWVFGWFDIGLFELLEDKFTEAEASAKKGLRPVEPVKLKEIIDIPLDELTFSTPSGDSDLSAVDKLDAEKQNATTDKADPEAERAARDLARKQLDMAKRKRDYQTVQKKYRQKGIEQDKRDIQQTDAEINTLRTKI